MNEEGCGKKVDVVRKGYNGESEYEQQRVVEMEKGRYQEKEMCEMGQRGCQMNQLAQSKALIGQVLNGDTIFYPGEFLASTRLINMSLKKLSQISFSEIISEGYDG